MSWIAVGTVGGALVGGVLQSGAATGAANTQAGSAQNALGFQNQLYSYNANNLSPYINQGAGNLADINSIVQSVQPFGMQQFQQSPAYQFNLQQGQQAIDKGAAARGNFYAPQTLQDLSSFSQGLASNEYQNAFSNYWGNIQNMLAPRQQIAQQGLQAGGALAGVSVPFGQMAGQNITGAGNALAAGQIGSANAYNPAIGAATNPALYTPLMNQLLAQQQQSQVGATPGDWSALQGYTGPTTGGGSF
jgi:hypothetical protein